MCLYQGTQNVINRAQWFFHAFLFFSQNKLCHDHTCRIQSDALAVTVAGTFLMLTVWLCQWESGRFTAGCDLSGPLETHDMRVRYYTPVGFTGARVREAVTVADTWSGLKSTSKQEILFSQPLYSSSCVWVWKMYLTCIGGMWGWKIKIPMCKKWIRCMCC